MRRLLLFALLVVVFILLTAPLERYLTPLLGGPLARLGLTLEMKTLRLAPPAGIKGTALRLSADNFSLELDSLYVGILRSFEARGCDGARIDGTMTSDSVALEVSSLTPSRCIKVGRLTLEGTFDGAASITGVSLLHGVFGDKTEAHVALHTKGGTVGGYWPGNGPSPAADIPLGEWDFQEAEFDAAYRNGKLEVKEGKAHTDGVVWELLGASLLADRGDAREVRIDFRARIEEDTPRAKALIGLMPKASEGAGGWRHFRVIGPLTSMKLIGLQ